MGWNRFFNGYLDLITLWFLSSFGRKPMHVFGFLGTLVFMIGFLSALGLGIDKLWCLANGIPQRLVTSSPFFYIALTMMMIGTQLFLARRKTTLWNAPLPWLRCATTATPPIC